MERVTDPVADPKPIAKERARKLYTSLSEGGIDLGVANFDEFLQGIEEPHKRKALYDSLVANGVTGLGASYEDFEQDIVIAGPMPLKKKEDSTSVAVPSATSPDQESLPSESSGSQKEEADPSELEKTTEISEDFLGEIIDMTEEEAQSALMSRFAGTTYNVEQTGLGDAIVIEDMLGNNPPTTIDLQPFTEKGRSEEISKLKTILGTLSADKRSKLVSPNRFSDYREGVDTYVAGLQQRYPDFEFRLDQGSGELFIAKGDESVSIWAEPGDRDSYHKINKFIYDNVDAEKGYDWGQFTENMKAEVDDISISNKRIKETVYNTDYFNELIAFSEASGVPVDEATKERLSPGTKTIYENEYSMSQKGNVPRKVKKPFTEEEINQYKNESFDPKIVEEFEKKRMAEVTGQLVDRQKQLRLETFLNAQPNREAYRDVVLQQMNETVDKENKALVDGLTSIQQYKDVASSGYENVISGLKGKLEGEAVVVDLPNGAGGTYQGIQSLNPVPSKNDMALIQAANENLMAIDLNWKELSEKVAGDMKRSLASIEETEPYMDALSRNYSSFDAAVNDFNKTSQNFLMDISAIGIALKAEAIEAAGGSAMIERAQLRDIEKDKRELERQENTFASKMTYEEALEVGREGEFILREFGTQAPYIVAAIGASGAGAAMQVGRIGTQAMVGSMFGLSTAGAKYDEIGTRQKIAVQAKAKLEELESLKGQIPDKAYAEAKYDYERSIRSNDISSSDKALAVVGAGIIEGTITGFVGTAPNALKVVQNIKAPNQVVKRMLQSNYKATANAFKEIGIATGREILEETSIEALTVLNDAGFLGDKVDFSMLDDVAITSIITSGGMNVPGTAYSTLITQTGIKRFQTGIKQKTEQIKDMKRMLLNEDLTGVQRFAVHTKINSLMNGIAEDMEKAEADVLLLGEEGVKDMLTLGGLNTTLLRKAGVESNDNYEQANAKIASYLKALPKEEALEYKGQLEAIAQRRKETMQTIDYKEASERVFGDRGAELAAKVDPGLTPEETYRAVYKQMKGEIQTAAVNEMAKSMAGTKQAFGEKIEKGQWGMLTAENPNAKQGTPEQNKEANERAVAWLEAKGYKPQPIQGKYGIDKNSFFVEDLTTEDAIEFAKEFQQESVATDKGLIYQDGSMYARTGQNMDSKADDNFSIMQTDEGPVKFEVGYDFSAKTNLDNGLNELRSAFEGATPALIDEQIERAQRSVSWAMPDLQIIALPDAEYQEQVGNDSTGAYQQGPSGRQIVINRDKATKTTVAHEVFHALLFDRVGNEEGVEIAETADNMLSAVRKVAEPELLARIEAFSEKYHDLIQSEEAIAELFGILASEFKTLDKPTQNIIIQWIQKLAKMLGLREMTDAEAIDFINSRAMQVAKGERIEKQTTETVDTMEVITRDQKRGVFDLKYFADTNEYAKMERDGLVENNATLTDLTGQQLAVHQPDNMFVGTVDRGDKKIFKGHGGVLYVLETGNVWASGAQNSANALAKLINDSAQNSPDGKGRMLLVRGTDPKMLSSTDGVKGGMLILEEIVDEGLVPRKDFRSSLIRVGRKYGVNFEGSTAATAIRKDIENKFIKPNDSTFQKRGDFLRDLIEDISKTSEAARENSKKVTEFLGSDKRITQFSKKGVTNAMGKILTEKMLQDLPSSHAYAVVETNGEVEVFNDSKKHPSYPWALRTKDGSKPLLKLLGDRPHAVKSGVLSAKDGSSATYGKIGLSQRGMGTAIVRQQKGGKPTVQEVKQYARDNNVSPEATRQYLEELGYTPEQINADGKKQAHEDALAKFDISRKRGNKYSQNKEAAIEDLKKSQYYQVADDIGRDQAMKDLLYALDEKPKNSPSKNKIMGKKPKKVTVNEYSALKAQIRLEARAARDAKSDLNEKRKRLAGYVKDLAKAGVLTANQAKVIINKISSVNLDSETSVQRFVDYMDKVYKDAALADRILQSNKKRKSAKKNLKKKVGSAPALMAPLSKLFSIDARMIPVSVLDEYSRVLNEFSGRDAVLELRRSDEVLADVEKIFEAIDEETNQIPQLALTYNTLANPDMGFTDSVNDLVNRGVITEEEGELMKKYKKDILPPKEKEAQTPPPDKFEIRPNNVEDTLEKKSAARLIGLVKKAGDQLKELSRSELMNLQGVLNNIEAGYFSAYGMNLANEIEAIMSKNEMSPKIAKKLSITVDRMIGRLKSIAQSSKMAVEYMIRQNPLYDIDTVLGNHNSKVIYDRTFGKVAKAYARMQVEVDVVTEKLLRAEAVVAKHFKNNPNKITESKFRQMLYLLQKEFEANPDSNQVFSAYDAAMSVIKNYRSIERYNKKEAEMLQGIVDKYNLSEDGALERLEKSFSKAENEAISIVEEVNSGLQDKFVHTAAVIRGAMPPIINSYVHHSVAQKHNDTIDTVTRKYNNFRSFSTKSGTVIERTGGVKPLNLDPITSTMSGARETLTDYYMTAPVKTVFKTLNKLKDDVDNDPKSTEHQKDVAESLVKTFEDAARITFANDFRSDDIKMFNHLRALGYKALLASIPRALAELKSNLLYVTMANGKEFFGRGVRRYGKLAVAHDSREIMKNVGSEQTGKLYGKKVTGKSVDVGLFPSEGNFRGTTARNLISNKIEQIRRYLSKGTYTPINVVADALISTPDKAISRPLWFGAFSAAFKNESGKEPNFDKIKENDAEYMEANQEAIDKATKYADLEVTRAATSVNPFNSILKNKVEPGRTANRMIKEANGFMTNFIIYEYTAARSAIYALLNNGDISKKKAAALLGATTLRMSSYYVLYQGLVAGFDMAASMALGLDLEEEEIDYQEMFMRQLVGSGLQMVLGRNLGNVARVPIAMGVETMNDEWFGFLRNGEDYDPYKHGLFYSPVNREQIQKGKTAEALTYLFTGPYSPLLKTLIRTGTVVGQYSNAKKESTKQAKIDELKSRTILEILGNLGMVPLYKDVRRILLKDMYGGFSSGKKKGKKKARDLSGSGFESDFSSGF